MSDTLRPIESQLDWIVRRGQHMFQESKVADGEDFWQAHDRAKAALADATTALDLLDELAAALDSVLLHYAKGMPSEDLRSRASLVSQAEAFLGETKPRTYSLAEIRNGTGWAANARFVLVEDEEN